MVIVSVWTQVHSESIYVSAVVCQSVTFDKAIFSIDCQMAPSQGAS